MPKYPEKKAKRVRKEGSKEAVHVQEKKETGKDGSKEAVQESKKTEKLGNTKRSRNQP